MNYSHLNGGWELTFSAALPIVSIISGAGGKSRCSRREPARYNFEVYFEFAQLTNAEEYSQNSTCYWELGETILVSGNHSQIRHVDRGKSEAEYQCQIE